MWEPDVLHGAVERMEAHLADGSGPTVARRPLEGVIADPDLPAPGAAPLELLGRDLRHTVRLHRPGSPAHPVTVPSTASALEGLSHGVLNQA